MLCVWADSLVLEAQHHRAVERVEASLDLVAVLVATVAQLHDKGQHPVVLRVVEGEARALQQLVVQLVHVLHHNLVDGEVSLLSFTLRVHHRYKVAVPVDHLLPLLVGIVGKARYILVFDARQLTSIRAYDVLHLPHIEHKFGSALLS